MLLRRASCLFLRIPPYAARVQLDLADQLQPPITSHLLSGPLWCRHTAFGGAEAAQRQETRHATKSKPDKTEARTLSFDTFGGCIAFSFKRALLEPACGDGARTPTHLPPRASSIRRRADGSHLSSVTRTTAQGA